MQIEQKQDAPLALPSNAPMHRKTIGLVQINNSFSGQSYLPYAAALLETYIRAHSPNPESYEFLTPIYKRIGITKSVDALHSADIIGFSTYVWNVEVSLAIASRIKNINPDVLIVFGGPSVPDAPEAFLRANPFIDVAVHNEGEKTFLDLLENFPGYDWSGIEGISFVDRTNGVFVKTPARPRFKDLDQVPSPFLNGAFDSVMRQNPTEKWIGLWETNRGCPFRCTFCDWGSATAAKVTKFGDERLADEAEWFGAKKIEYVFCCDANFGIQRRDAEIARKLAEVKARTSYPRVFSVQGTKNQTERAYEMHKILSDSGLNNGVVLSMQSMDMQTLTAIKRDNISLNTYLELQRRFTNDGVETYSDLILGLPGETYESFVEGVNVLMLNGQHNRIQFNNLSILPNSEMGNADYRAKYDIQVIRSKIINLHGEKIVLEDDVEEYQDLVVSTATMSREDWQRTRCFCWMVAFLHFDKLFQLPILLAQELFGLSYRKIVESFLEAEASRYPIISGIVKFFRGEAAGIQNGGAEWTYSEKYLGIYWTADEFAFIKLVDDGLFDVFYDEAKALMASLVEGPADDTKNKIMDEAVQLNRALVRRPFVSTDLTWETEFDHMTFWKFARAGIKQPIGARKSVTVIQRAKKPYDKLQDWCREVVWWGNKRGAYLYPNEAKTIEVSLAGHH
jgi:radical SAM superfamily enzyme YgiQ (UPF0313 family)